MRYGEMTEAELLAWGDVQNLPRPDIHFMPEIRTAIDPVTHNELRFAIYQTAEGRWEIAKGNVSRTREMADDGIEADYAAVDASIRASIWYTDVALRVAPSNDEIKAFIAEADPHRIGSWYNVYSSGSPVGFDSIKTIDDLIAWANFEIEPLALEREWSDAEKQRYIGQTLTYQRQVAIAGNGDEREAIAQLCCECALMIAGLRVGLFSEYGGHWRVPPETDIRSDMFGRKIVSFYARAMVNGA